MIATGMRQQNLAQVLELLHLRGPLARAALTDLTGLNRSTIGALVATLTEHGLVTEGAPDPARRVGRPSPVVSLTGTTAAIAVNPEVDAITIAAVTLDRTVLARERMAWNGEASPDRAVELIAACIARWQDAELQAIRIAGIGLAVPGLVRTEDGTVRDAPHLGWRDVPLAARVTAATGIPAHVGNDATLGAGAEHLFGAARGYDDVVYLNGGASGIGGGVIVHGMTLRGAGGYAGEFGQNRPGIGDAADRTNAAGVLEDEVHRSRLTDLLGAPDALDDELGALLVASTDTAVVHEVARQRRILATALANAVNVLNPGVIVLGGFLAALTTDALDELTEAVRGQAMPACGEHLAIRAASLAADRLLIGAAELAFAPLLAAPAG